VALNLNLLRLRAVWLIVIPFFWFATPTPTLLAVGAALTLLGLTIRGWSAGTIHKNEELTTSGPYAHTRNPLYFGSLFIGLGVTTAGGSWLWPALFLAFFVAVYSRTMAHENRQLHELFGDAFDDYRNAVPAFVPRLRPYCGEVSADQAGGFEFSQYRRNREWEASLGALAAFVILAAKLMWS